MTTILKLSVLVAIVIEIHRLWKQPQSRYVLVRSTREIRPR